MSDQVKMPKLLRKSDFINASDSETDLEVSSDLTSRIRLQEVHCKQLEQGILELKAKYIEHRQDVELKNQQIAHDKEMETLLKENLQGTNESIAIKEIAIFTLKQQCNYILEKSQKFRDNIKTVIKMYDQHLKETKKMYEKLPMAQKKRKKEIELFKVKIKLNIMRQNVEEQKRKTKQIMDIRKRRKQLQIIKFAENMIKYRHILKIEQEIKKYQNQITALMKKKHEMEQKIALKNKLTEEEINLVQTSNLSINMNFLELPQMSPMSSCETEDELEMISQNLQKSVTDYEQQWATKTEYIPTSVVTQQPVPIHITPENKLQMPNIIFENDTKVIDATNKRKHLSVSFNLSKEDTNDSEIDDFLKRKIAKLDLEVKTKEPEEINSEDKIEIKSVGNTLNDCHTGHTQTLEGLKITDVSNINEETSNKEKDVLEIGAKQLSQEQRNNSVPLPKPQEVTPRFKQPFKMNETKSPYFEASFQGSEADETYAISPQIIQDSANEEAEKSILHEEDVSIDQSMDFTEPNHDYTVSMDTICDSVELSIDNDMSPSTLQYCKDMQRNSGNSMYAESTSDIQSVSNFILSPDEMNIRSPPDATYQNLNTSMDNRAVASNMFNMFGNKPKPANSDDKFTFSFGPTSTSKSTKLFNMF